MPSKSESSDPIFHCTQCGECCKGYGGTYISQEDIEKISKHLNISVQDFLTDYCQYSGGKPLLAVGQNGYCVFWNKNCQIHSIKPRMCRAWPYIESVLKDTANWKAMASCCPGMRPNASNEKILEIVRLQLDKMR